jgi:hypothetical protein
MEDGETREGALGSTMLMVEMRLKAASMEAV